MLSQCTRGMRMLPRLYNKGCAFMQLYPLTTLPLIEVHDDLAMHIARGLAEADLVLATGDLLVVAQKIVSKSEGRQVALAEVEPSGRALGFAAKTDKDPRLVELILRESVAVIRSRPGLLIVEHRLGFVHANAGVDQSNIDGADHALLLPEDPDASALELRNNLEALTGIAPYVLINDSCGRAWRNGITGMAIGCAGFAPMVSCIGGHDLFGRKLVVTEVAVADELAAAASHLMGQGAEGVPVVLVRGAKLEPSELGTRTLIRERHRDLFR